MRTRSTSITGSRRHGVRRVAILAGSATVAVVVAVVTGGTPVANAAASTLVGFAAVNGTTTGGVSGPTVTVTSRASLVSEAASSGPKTIRVSGMFSGTGDIPVSSDKTIIGVGAGSGLNGAGLVINGVHNVIVQNLKISNVTADSGNGDAIHIEKSDHIWLDHNDLSSDMAHQKDFYDGLIDITHGGDYITVSWNYLHDHWKTSLVGHSDNNAAEDTGHLRVTYHHNYIRNFDSRGPSLRFGTGHIFNNYYVNGDKAIHSRMGAQTLVQNNVFVNVSNPIQTTESSAVDGFTNQSGNDLGGGVNKITQVGNLTNPGYSYTLDPTSQVASIVTAGAGTGKVG